MLAGEGEGGSLPQDLLTADGLLVIAKVIVVRVEGQRRIAERAHFWRLARAGEVVAPPEDVERIRLLTVGQAVARRARGRSPMRCPEPANDPARTLRMPPRG